MARYRKHTITREDTIQGIAQRYNGDISFWKTIVEYNKLKYPYIVSTTQDREQRPEDVLTIGDTILIPIEQNLLDIDTNALGNRDRDLILNLSLGSDLQVTGGNKRYQQHGTRDEVFELSGNGQGDIAISSGIENIKQALINRLLTKRGSLILHPNYGSDIHTLVGNKASSITHELIDNEISRVLKSDDRVRRVKKEFSIVENEKYSGEFTITLYSVDEMFRVLISEGEEGLIIT